MGIKNTFISALYGEKGSVKDLFQFCHDIAIAYLKAKTKRNHFLLQFLYSDYEDLALDCIADLFELENGRFKKLENYVCIEEVKKLTESEFNSKLRQLIFSKVNDGLFRNYQNFDPSLSKIIRNLKRTLENDKIEGVRYCSKTGFIELIGNEDHSLPVIPDEILEIRLSSFLQSINNMVDAVQALKTILGRENQYASKIRVVSYAVILRKAFAGLLEAEEVHQTDKSIFTERELHKFVSSSILKLKDQLRKTYVDSEKVNRFHFSKYLAAAADILKADYVEDSPREGYFEHFSFYFPEVPHERYRSHHRKIIEYLVKKIRDQLIYDLRMEEKFSRINKW